MRKRSAALAAAVTACSLALAACSGGAHGGGGSAPAPSAPAEASGRDAARVLLEMIDGEPARSVERSPGRLMVRGSTGVPAPE